jgi:hypothetical protein
MGDAGHWFGSFCVAPSPAATNLRTASARVGRSGWVRRQASTKGQKSAGRRSV